jgi:MoaA/NifB/PqqE/SkfB family radical SAM enzyme
MTDQPEDRIDWRAAPWIDPDKPWNDPLPVPDRPERLLMDYATRCNLRCPMCPVWGSEDNVAIDGVKGIMDLESSRRVLDAFSNAKPMVQPNMYGEPLLIPKLEEVLRDIKSRGMPIALNTNGLTLTDRLAELFCALPVDAVMFSIDSVTPETLMKVRGVDRLEKIEEAVFRLMRVRGNRAFPRIGVSFTTQDTNRHEEAAFVAKWVGQVDVVRTGLLFDAVAGTFPEMHANAERKPCPALYKTLPVHNDGGVRICCLDGFRATDMGNVFETSVETVWHGEEFAKARYHHETAQWDKVPFCKSCNGWAEYDYEEELRDGVLIRRSPQYTYYNLVARLRNWSGALLAGHKPPPAELVDTKEQG